MKNNPVSTRKISLLTRSAVPGLLLALLSLLPGFLPANTGGGYLDRGPVGEYYDNATLSAPSAFTRRDVRIDFDWETFRAPGGSVAEPYASFPLDNFSVRWTGRVMPRFTETYTFKVICDDGARLYIKPEGEPTYTALVDQWDTAGTHTAAYAMTADAAYDIQVEYKELSDAAQISLLWSSASTPEEVLDVAAHHGTNVTHWTQGITDIVKCARSSWQDYNGYSPGMDPGTGWPTTDFSYTFQESLNEGLGIDPLMRGTVSFSFKGKGTPSTWGNVLNGNGNVQYSYDSGNNTTTGTFETEDRGINASYFRVADTDRDGSGTDHDGVTDLKLMRPDAPDSTTAYAEDTLILPNFKEAYDHFTGLRVDLNNGNQERFWSDRTLPAFFNQRGGKATDRIYSTGDPKSNGPSWEHKVMLCNETGRDLYINFPMCVTGWEITDTTSYVYKLAMLIKYGSDGTEPTRRPRPARFIPRSTRTCAAMSN